MSASDVTLTYTEAETVVDMTEHIVINGGLGLLAEDSREAVEIIIRAAKDFEERNHHKAHELNLDMDLYWDAHSYYEAVADYADELLCKHE